MNASCDIWSRTTCGRTAVVQQQGLPAAAAAAAAAEACSSRKLQTQQAAETTNKQKYGLSCALIGTRWNQYPHFFVALFVRDQAVQPNEMKKSEKALVLNSRRPNRLGIL